MSGYEESSTTSFSTKEVVEKVYSVPYWRQAIPIRTSDGSTILTPGRSTAEKYHRLNLGDLSGKDVLDIGAWDGLHSFLAEEDGASTIVAVDVYDRYGDYGGRWENIRDDAGDAGIQTAKHLRNSSVDHRDMSVYDVTPDTLDKFDVVLLPSVLYHLRYPAKALDQLYEVTNEYCVVETIIAPNGDGMYLDSSDTAPWWLPSEKTLIDMLSTAGFSTVQIIDRSYHPFERQIAGAEPGTELVRNEEHIRLDEWTRISIHADGDSIPLPEGDDRWYVELTLDDVPIQGWIDKSAVHGGLKGQIQMQGPLDFFKAKVRDQIRRGSFGRLGYRVADIPERIVLHAYR